MENVLEYILSVESVIQNVISAGVAQLVEQLIRNQQVADCP